MSGFECGPPGVLGTDFGGMMRMTGNLQSTIITKEMLQRR